MKTLRPLILSLSLFGLVFMGVHGQETGKTVHLKVIKGGETTVDTVFSASELEDEDLHKKISELAGVDFEIMHEGDMSMHAGHKEHASHKEGHSFTYVTVDDFEESDGKVKKKIIIKTGGEGVIIKTDGEGEGESEEVIIIKDGKEVHDKGEYIIIKELEKDDDGHVQVIKVKKGDGDSEEVRVEITANTELHKSHEKKGGVYVVVGDDKDGTIIVHKDVKVLKSIGEDGEVIEITVVIDGGEKEKMKEKSKETKQKKEKDRNKK